MNNPPAWTGLQEQTTESIRTMRRRIDDISRESPIVHNVLSASRYAGLSGEDTMTYLAHEAIRRMLHLEKVLLDANAMRPAPPVVLDASSLHQGDSHG